MDTEVRPLPIPPRCRGIPIGDGNYTGARWDAYYAAHPEKLKAKLEREAVKKKAAKKAGIGT